MKTWRLKCALAGRETNKQKGHHPVIPQMYMAWNSWRKILTYLFLYSLQFTEEEKEEKDQHAALWKAKQNNVIESPAPKPRYANNEWTSCLSASCYWRQHGDAFSGSSCVTFASSCNSKQQAKESGKHWTADCDIKIVKKKKKKLSLRVLCKAVHGCPEKL